MLKKLERDTVKFDCKQFEGIMDILHSVISLKAYVSLNSSIYFNIEQNRTEILFGLKHNKLIVTTINSIHTYNYSTYEFSVKTCVVRE